MHNLSIPYFINCAFQYDCLYQFWWRSQGLWFSKSAKMTLRLLDEQELQRFQHIHALERPEFGIRIAWEYQTNTEICQILWCGVKMTWEYQPEAKVGHLFCCIDVTQPGLVFASQDITNNNLSDIYQYQMVDNLTLITTDGKNERRISLEEDGFKLREVRTGGKLIKRIWENRISA